MSVVPDSELSARHPREYVNKSLALCALSDIRASRVLCGSYGTHRRIKPAHHELFKGLQRLKSVVHAVR